MVSGASDAPARRAVGADGSRKDPPVKPRDRILHALHHEEPDRVPTGENEIDYVLAEQLLGRTTLYNSRWRDDPEQGRAVLDEAPGVGGAGRRPGTSATNFGDRTLASNSVWCPRNSD